MYILDIKIKAFYFKFSFGYCTRGPTTKWNKIKIYSTKNKKNIL